MRTINAIKNIFIKSKYRKLREGSAAVEAAAVMPIIFLAVFGCLYLSFYVHNRAWLTAAAYEAALTGSMEGVHAEDETAYEAARMRSLERGNVGFFGAENLTSDAKTGKEVVVTYELDTKVPYGGMQWHLSVSGSFGICRPVKRIRQMKAAAEVFL